MRIVRTVVVDCHIEDVARHLAREHGHPEGAGARVDVTALTPDRVSWREDEVLIAYTLESVWTSTRLTRTEIAPDGPALLRPLRAALRGRAATERLRAVRVALERSERRGR